MVAFYSTLKNNRKDFLITCQNVGSQRKGIPILIHVIGYSSSARNVVKLTTSTPGSDPDCYTTYKNKQIMISQNKNMKKNKKKNKNLGLNQHSISQLSYHQENYPLGIFALLVNCFLVDLPNENKN